MLLSASRDSTMRLWNLEMRRNLVIYKTISPVWQAQFCNRGFYFAAATADQTVSLWSTEKVQPVKLIFLTIYCYFKYRLEYLLIQWMM